MRIAADSLAFLSITNNLLKIKHNRISVITTVILKLNVFYLGGAKVGIIWRNAKE